MRPRDVMACAAAALCVALAAAVAAAPAAPKRPATHTEITVTPESAHATDADEVDADDLDDDLDLLAADVPAGHGAGHGGPGMGRMRMGPGGAATGDLHAKLNLTDDQKAKMADVHERQARRAIPIEADLKLAALDLHKLMRADRPDQRAIDVQVDKIAGLRASLQKSRIAAMLEARSLLTPAQQKTLRDARGGMGIPGMMRRHRMMGHGMGAAMDGGPMERGVNTRMGP